MMREAAFQVKIGEFEGPLDLLLSLIERRKMHISEVSLSSVTEDFLTHMRALESTVSHRDMADFVSVASTLLLIKSLSLLPGLAVAPEETASIEELENRLAEYKKVKERAKELQNMFGPMRLFPRGDLPQERRFSPGIGLTKEALREAIQAIIATFPILAAVPQTVVRAVVSLEDVLNRLMERAERHLSTSFKEFVSGAKNRADVIVSFLGVLELVRRGSVVAHQEEHGEDIRIETHTITIPHYGA